MTIVDSVSVSWPSRVMSWFREADVFFFFFAGVYETTVEGDENGFGQDRTIDAIEPYGHKGF